MVTPSGTKEFFVRLINPIGETVAIESNGGGVLINKLDESQVRYTYSATMEYNNEDTEGCLDWTLSDRLPKGELYEKTDNYRFVDIFHSCFSDGS